MLDFWTCSWSLKELALSFRVRKESSSCFQFLRTCGISMQDLAIWTELVVMGRRSVHGWSRSFWCIVVPVVQVPERHVWLLTVFLYNRDFPPFLLSSLTCAIPGPGRSFHRYLKMATSVAGAHRLFHLAHSYNTWVVGQVRARHWEHKDGRKQYLFSGSLLSVSFYSWQPPAVNTQVF